MSKELGSRQTREGGPNFTIADFYNEEALKYDKGYSTSICYAEDEIAMYFIKPWLGGKVLDVGCGTGVLLKYCSPSLYHGFDISPKMVQVAKSKFPENDFSVADMHRLPFDPESFDTLISLYGPMSYSLEPDKLLAEFARVLVPGGILAVMPYTKRVEHDLCLGDYSTANNYNIPKIYYTSEMLAKLFRNSCFTNVRIVGINYFANHIEEMARQYKIENPDGFYREYLFKEIGNVDLPVEYARHALVLAQKPK